MNSYVEKHDVIHLVDVQEKNLATFEPMMATETSLGPVLFAVFPNFVSTSPRVFGKILSGPMGLMIPTIEGRYCTVNSQGILMHNNFHFREIQVGEFSEYFLCFFPFFLMIR